MCSSQQMTVGNKLIASSMHKHGKQSGTPATDGTWNMLAVSSTHKQRKQNDILYKVSEQYSQCYVQARVYWN